MAAAVNQVGGGGRVCGVWVEEGGWGESRGKKEGGWGESRGKKEGGWLEWVEGEGGWRREYEEASAEEGEV